MQTTVTTVGGGASRWLEMATLWVCLTKIENNRVVRVDCETQKEHSTLTHLNEPPIGA